MARSDQEEAAASGAGELLGKAGAVGGGDVGVQDGRADVQIDRQPVGFGFGV